MVCGISSGRTDWTLPEYGAESDYFPDSFSSCLGSNPDHIRNQQDSEQQSGLTRWNKATGILLKAGEGMRRLSVGEAFTEIDIL